MPVAPSLLEQGPKNGNSGLRIVGKLLGEPVDIQAERPGRGGKDLRRADLSPAASHPVVESALFVKHGQSEIGRNGRLAGQSADLALLLNEIGAGARIPVRGSAVVRARDSSRADHDGHCAAKEHSLPSKNTHLNS